MNTLFRNPWDCDHERRLRDDPQRYAHARGGQDQRGGVDPGAMAQLSCRPIRVIDAADKSSLHVRPTPISSRPSHCGAWPTIWSLILAVHPGVAFLGSHDRGGLLLRGPHRMPGDPQDGRHQLHRSTYIFTSPTTILRPCGTPASAAICAGASPSSMMKKFRRKTRPHPGRTSKRLQPVAAPEWPPLPQRGAPRWYDSVPEEQAALQGSGHQVPGPYGGGLGCGDPDGRHVPRCNLEFFDSLAIPGPGYPAAHAIWLDDHEMEIRTVPLRSPSTAPWPTPIWPTA